MITATDLTVSPISAATFDSFEQFAAVSHTFDAEYTLLEVDTRDGRMPVISLDLDSTLRNSLANFIA
tara:strand:+ start:11255 stop:11455 length:201 start_codon:yes stop_codon:yes gene_type:complete